MKAHSLLVVISHIRYRLYMYVIRKGIQLGSGGDPRSRSLGRGMPSGISLAPLTHSLTHADIIICWVNGAFSTGRWHAAGMFMDGFVCGKFTTLMREIRAWAFFSAALNHYRGSYFLLRFRNKIIWRVLQKGKPWRTSYVSGPTITSRSS